ncbi:hypothetical protein BGZ54_006632 [Gamsiella multidivaricata]|nr:hypothetical protein BGZ54_006632 [Gamsiella multidivaricata]
MLPSGCAGYPLGYPSRTDVDINTKYTYLVKDRLPDAPLCQPGRQNVPGNNPFPPASVTPGQTLHLTWQPDGHLDDSHPSFIEVHWSGVPAKQLYTRSELNPATLLGTMTFGTSANCDQPWEPNTWCHGYLTIPAGTQPGTYQLIWWWKYDRNPSGEEYSTCFEIVVGGSETQPRDISVRALAQTESSSPLIKTHRLSQMTTESNWSSASASSENFTPALETLKDMASKPDEPLSVVPDFSIVQDSKEDQAHGNDYVDDKTGTLAGDAINDEEDADVPPLPVATPTQLISSTLDEHHDNTDDVSSTEHKSADSNRTLSPMVNQNGTLNTNYTPNNSTDSSTGLPTSRPEHGGTEFGSPRNQTLARQMPTFKSAAFGTIIPPLFVDAMILSSALAALTWIVI